MRKRIISALASLAMVFSLAAELPAAAAEVKDAEDVTSNSPTVEAEQPVDTEGTSELRHAYDPMAELEAQQAEQEMRENTEIVSGTVLFSVEDEAAVAWAWPTARR